MPAIASGTIGDRLQGVRSIAGDELEAKIVSVPASLIWKESQHGIGHFYYD
jgi:hypothetical protein